MSFIFIYYFIICLNKYSCIHGGCLLVVDDRDERPGIKFNDAELIGIPYQIIVGKRSCENIVEVKNRKTLEKVEMSVKDAIEFIFKKVTESKKRQFLQ